MKSTNVRYLLAFVLLAAARGRAFAGDDAIASFNRGVVLEREGRHAAAAEAYRRAMRAEPWLLEPRVNLGVELARLGRSSEALHVFDEATRLWPASYEAHYNRGLVLSERGRHGEAEAAFARARALLDRGASALPGSAAVAAALSYEVAR
jgi:tetratricopeptide (TPR) repeat protein